MFISRISLIVTLLLLGELTVIGQENGKAAELVLSGTVSKMQTYCYKDREPMAWLHLVFQFRNDSAEPIVIIPPGTMFDQSAKFGSGLSEGQTVTANSVIYSLLKDDPFSTVTTRDEADFLRSTFRGLAKGQPPVIQPGAFYEFRQNLLLTNGFTFDSKLVKSKPSECPDAPAPNPLHQFLSIEYRLSAKKFATGDFDLSTLAALWKPQGRLILDSSGDVVYKAQRIVLPNSDNLDK